MEGWNKTYNRIILTASVITAALILSACPHQFVSQLEIMFPDSLNNIRQHRPVFINSQVSETNIQKMTAKFKNDSSYRSKILMKRYNIPADSLNSVSFQKILSDSSISFYNLNLLPVNSSKYPHKISIIAHVGDLEDNVIRDLAPPYYKGTDSYKKYWFSVTDSCNGRIHDISDYEVKEIRSVDAGPQALAFVLDHSGSMGDIKAIKLQQALNKILPAIKPGDMVSVIKFASQSQVEIPLTDSKNDFKRIREDGLRGMETAGTNIFGAVKTGITELAKADSNKKRIMILFSDGFDEASKDKLDSIQLMCREKNITIYTIAYGFGDSEILLDIAETTGGNFYYLISSKEFAYVFASIYISLNNHYLITYTPPDCADYHDVSVGLNIPGSGFESLRKWGWYDETLISTHDPVGTMKMLNIQFEYNSDKINKESIPLLEEVASSMKKYQGIEILVRGHTDDIGSEDYNMELSERRAFSVKKYLVQSGIDKGRIEIEGLGENSPLVPNTNEENRKLNRRTEFVIIKK